MNYFVFEKPTDHQRKTAMSKARVDINEIVSSLGFTKITIDSTRHDGVYRIFRQFDVLKSWKKYLSKLKAEDIVLIQYPPVENSIFLHELFARLAQKGIKFVILIHDLMTEYHTTALKKALYNKEEGQMFINAYKIIAHNQNMVEKLKNKYDAAKIIPLHIFDYLIPDLLNVNWEHSTISKNLPIIIAGNLNPKYGGAYLKELPMDLEYNMYGIGFEENNLQNVHYKGSFNPDELSYKMHGSFGLVWYGDSAKNCIGEIHDYLKIINPHRTSAYLSAGIPVICWSQTGIADFIIKNNCGFVVESLYDIADIIHNMSDEKYAEMKNNAEIIGQKLRSGFYLRKAISNIESC